MSFGFHRRQVIDNIRQNVGKKQFNAKAELNDPVLSKGQTTKIVKQFLQHTQSWNYKILNPIFQGVFGLATIVLTTRGKVEGMQNLPNCPSAFITGNHYNQFDVLMIKKLAMKKKKRLYAVVAASNLEMPHLIGWIVRNFDSLPIDCDMYYLSHIFPQYLKKTLKKPCWILIYPEQELWFNYRKPCPLKKGAYFYAAKLNKPIISTFTEIQVTSKHEFFHRGFYKKKKILHILPTIYPDPNLFRS